MIDIAMDLCALCAVQLGFGALRFGRLLLAELVLASGTLLAMLLGRPGALAQAAVYLLSGALLVDARRPLQMAEAGACLLCAYAAEAGLAVLGEGIAPLAPLGALLLMWIVRGRRNARFRWNVELYVELDGRGDRFPALIDTGNRLRDRRSGLPVLIVEASAAPNFAAAAALRDPSEARTLPFGVLGSAGELRCYRPDRVELRAPGRPPRAAPACLVGAYPGRIPGPIRALAPPEFADAAAPAHSLRAPIERKKRRVRHEVF